MPDIIIVEDNREIGTLLCDFLRKENYTVSLVDTGEKALQIFEQYGANLVVIDIGLPGVDGYSVCSKIRETSNAQKCSDLPVVLYDNNVRHYFTSCPVTTSK